MHLVRVVVATALLAGSLAASAIPSMATDRTLVLQQGRSGYSGVADTWVSNADWDTPPQFVINYGANPLLTLTRDGDDNPLLRFDLGQIPANSQVRSATLKLYNTTAAACDRDATAQRHIGIHQVLQPWDAGNQVAGPIDAAGKHGATGANRFGYAPGEGSDVPWSQRAMGLGSDYAAEPVSTTAVGNAGWYEWDVLALVRAQVRGETANHGMVLRDITGYEDDNCDSRAFVSSDDAARPALRPILEVAFNPDVPFADAGADVRTMSWDGAQVILDGSRSHDRPGGDDTALTYSWIVTQAAYGSRMQGRQVAAQQVGSFRPDAAGQWELEVTVTNGLGESATDRVSMHLLRLPTAHPRLYITEADLPALRGRADDSYAPWVALAQESQDPQATPAQALVSLVQDSPALCSQALAGAQASASSEADWATKGGEIAVIFDWCHAQLTPDQQAGFVAYLNGWADRNRNAAPPGWGNYWPRYTYSLLMIGLATWGDNPRATEWIDEFRTARFERLDLPALRKVEAGGSWPEGTVYDGVANYDRIKAIEAWRVATGENLFKSTTWFANRAAYLLLVHHPVVADNWGHYYHPYPSIGDAERNRGAMMNYERIMGLILIGRFPDTDAARQLQAYFSAPPANESWGFLAHEEFLWYRPQQAKITPRRLTNYSPSQGQVVMRSGWPNGAGDVSGTTLDTNPTHVTFQSGDHFSYHQHYDQNSFTLFKGGDLAVDSGVYSGDGLSNHDINYYARTIAHNTLVVYNPAEDFGSARPDATSNDGGQRTMYPGSRAPESVEAWERGSINYDTGEMPRFADTPIYTYALGDATKAYNNPEYNQSQAAVGLAGNTAKVERFTREFVYLRPPRGQANAQDYLVIVDRVGVTNPTLSGANTKLLFHTLNRPAVADGTSTTVAPGETLYRDASAATTDAGAGRLFMKVLEPEAANLRVVGGQGTRAFWAFGANYDWQWRADEPQPRPISDFEDQPYGQWRIELEPADTATRHTFVTVLQPTLGGVSNMTPSALLPSSANVRAVHVDDPQLGRVAVFSTDFAGGTPAGTIQYDIPTAGPALNMVFDLDAGTTYSLTQTPNGNGLRVRLSPDGSGSLKANAAGVLHFTSVG